MDQWAATGEMRNVLVHNYNVCIQFPNVFSQLTFIGHSLSHSTDGFLATDKCMGSPFNTHLRMETITETQQQLIMWTMRNSYTRQHNNSTKRTLHFQVINSQ